LTSHCRNALPSIVLPPSVSTSYEVSKRWFIQAAVLGITCMVPIPPSQAMIADCQPLSCSATALTRRGGRLTCDTVQNGCAAADASADPTSALGAFSPS
jgi:hypothetical protein